MFERVGMTKVYVVLVEYNGYPDASYSGAFGVFSSAVLAEEHVNKLKEQINDEDYDVGSYEYDLDVGINWWN